MLRPILATLAIASLVAGASVATPSTPPPAPRPLLWLSGMTVARAESRVNGMSQLDKMAAYGVAGFQLDHVQNGTHDDLVSGPARWVNGALAPDPVYQASVAQLVSDAKADGITDIYQRVNGQVLARFHAPALAYKLDPGNPVDIAQMQSAMTAEGQFVANTGLMGVWFDFEPYNNTYQWRQEQDPASSLYGKDTATVRLAYFNEGKALVSALLSADPSIQVIMSPAMGYEGSGPTSVYEHYADMYAGMVYAASQTTAANGFVLATEGSYGAMPGAAFRGIYAYEDGYSRIGNHNGVDIYSNLTEALAYWSGQVNTDLLTWHLVHSSVALGSWPEALAQPPKSITLDGWQQVTQQIPAVSVPSGVATPKYWWIYSQLGYPWWQDQNVCTNASGQSATTQLDCYGAVLGQGMSGLFPAITATPIATTTPTMTATATPSTVPTDLPALTDTPTAPIPTDTVPVPTPTAVVPTETETPLPTDTTTATDTPTDVPPVPTDTAIPPTDTPTIDATAAAIAALCSGK